MVTPGREFRAMTVPAKHAASDGPAAAPASLPAGFFSDRTNRIGT